MKTCGFRVDAAEHIGTGHFQRCLTLAHQLMSQHISSTFFTRDYDSQLSKLLIDSGFEVCFIGESSIADTSSNHHNWLGVSQEQDAQEFISAIGLHLIDFLILDHYSIDHIWEDIIKSRINLPIIVIDDLANRYHNCDILIDQNYWPDLKYRYDTKVPNGCHCLLGPEFTLLRNEFSLLRQQQCTKQSTPKILVNFGGVGNMSIWHIVLPALVQCKRFNFHVITGKLTGNSYADCQNIISTSEHITIEEQSSQMSFLMKSSDFALGACGSTVWERFCLGLNSALIDIAANQKDLVHYLYVEDLIDYLGNLNSLTVDSVLRYLNQLELSSDKYKNRKAAILKLVDGKGAKRVVDTMLTHIKQQVC